MTAFQKLGNGLRGRQSADQPGDFAEPSRRFAAGAGAVPQGARAVRRGRATSAWIATIDLYQALVFYQERRLDESRLLCEQALGVLSRRPRCRARRSSASCCWRGSTWTRGAPERAKHICRHALGRLEQAETPALSYQAWFVLGVIEEELGDREAAYQAYLKAHRHLENLRSHLRSGGDEDRLPEGQAGSLRGAGAHVPGARRQRRRHAEAAFVYIEQAKSRSLADLIAFRAQDLPASRETAARPGGAGEHAARGTELV